MRRSGKGPKVPCVGRASGYLVRAMTKWNVYSYRRGDVLGCTEVTSGSYPVSWLMSQRGITVMNQA